MYEYKGLRYGFHPGIPARDISDAEAKERGCEDLLRESRAYQYVADVTAAAPAVSEAPITTATAPASKKP
ncbi:MAG: hypothetical protein AB7R89_25795 [Dehalococcoidia bacterium]